MSPSSAPTAAPTATRPAQVPFAAALGRFGGAPAVILRDRVLSYRDLSARVDALAERLGPVPRLVALAASNDLGSLVAYLAALAGGHPVAVVPADKPQALDSLLAAYDPDVVLRGGAEPVLEERRRGSIHVLHPDLALLMSTSGSTGSPKLVRLSHANVQSNAEAIAEYLRIGPADRAATTLPMSYCYGLSVINSHLLRGAALVLTDHSVVDPCFWEDFRTGGATSFAAVPYTFELLERVGFANMELDGLRYITQAGGRLDPGTVRRYAELGAERGWDLFVMYGQTEATARMAYLPPHLAATSPGSIGVPVPGGSFRIDPVPGLEHGELVYAGPNVMLGYAEGPADLAAGRKVTELRTGDLARQTEDGLYEVVGRRSRFVKIVGLRIDLGRVEAMLHELGVQSAAAGTDERVVVAVEDGHDPVLLAKLLSQGLGLPRGALQVMPVDALPRLENGKIDYPAVRALDTGEAAAPAGPAVPAETAAGAAPREDAKAIFRDTLDLEEVGDGDTFVSLGGDSLSYVAASIRLEKALGHLPADWHVTPVGRLVPQATAPSAPARRWRPARPAPLETGIVLRAVAIVCIISSHVGFFSWQGTAHVLMAVCGFNFARFQLGGERLPRLRRHLVSLTRIVVPSVAFIALAYAVTDRYTPANIALLNAIVGPAEITEQWHFWFIELLAYILLCVAALLTIPWAHRAERRFPFGFPLALAGVGLLARFGVLDPQVPHTMPVLWLFGLGWAAARARAVWQRVLLTAVAVASVPGYFEDDPKRNAIILGGVLLLVWLRSIPVPSALHRPLGIVASASLYAYLTHWLVYPVVDDYGKGLAVLASLASGIAYWAVATRCMNGAVRLAARIRGGAGRR
ncbi:AMP-dependent synthetase [Zafaria cholistanensis]|uniref:AMP-dependent synthetase n=1 Tax=Zafaria cholistanensis TaxID=1682741 RepID=A0A5A7NUI2_9MICC|nr:non-ribosomal peptide synthetase [Zafaria cholistanensis]GER23802.1 AMP-dependent synthetase [Zafaria cholistanensis]